MYFYPVYRYRSHSDGTFVRVGSIKGYAGPIGSRTRASLLREARRLFAIGEEDVILLGHSPIVSHAPPPIRLRKARSMPCVRRMRNNLHWRQLQPSVADAYTSGVSHE